MTNTPPVPPEPIEEYTPQEIEDAKKDIASLKPVDYLALQTYINNIEEQSKLPEAAFIVFTELRSPNSGAALNITVRSSNPISGLDEMVSAIRYARDRYGLMPVQKHSVTQRQPDTSSSASTSPDQRPPHAPAAPAAPKAPVVPAAPATRQEPVYQNEETAEGKKGTNVLKKIKVDEGKVAFSVGDFKYPFSDSRGAEKVAALFDDDLGWGPEHFDVKAAVYSPADWGNETLYVDWEKPLKYYNVLRIHR
jgi:hypothetical protein